MKKSLTFTLLLVAFSTCAQSGAALDITEIAPGVYMHTSYKIIEGYGQVGSNGLIVVDAGDAYIIDTPWSEADTESLLAWIAAQGLTLAASISTHSHEDRTAGIELLNSHTVPTYTSELTKSILFSAGKPIPTHTFKGNEFTLKQGVIELYYPGAGHTADNIVVWLPKNKVLFGGCLVRSHEWKSLGYVGDASIHMWASSVENIKARQYTIDIVVPGHGSVGKVDILDHTIALAKLAATKLPPVNIDASID
ncbi:DIM/SIM/IMP family subclass B1 metallo-beta-lactamase [Simiduia curdlanivorans]|uniref:beta-lactamase n=1 Tax=Simiduia curdlanivorans TaxID=1492769 RepID=A0ABV8V895_9GAMM|nr:DIM/SIM/IMP family subclass B1 metallo-beta-lactamase [Simiduia curdlanivorans]MDN3638620.1 DIM/SIM/IMP family subclass B1 metallo-beta-lactamase [Simiduia curdlanivorans]